MSAVAIAESAGDSDADTVKSGLDPLKKKEFSHWSNANQYVTRIFTRKITII